MSPAPCIQRPEEAMKTGRGGGGDKGALIFKTLFQFPKCFLTEHREIQAKSC